MTTFVPCPPYSDEELRTLYPKGLDLQLVQILLRHGERSPVSPRFQNAGLSPYWPYCNAAKRLSSVTMTRTDWSQWDNLQWRRRLETFGDDDGPVVARGPKGEIDGVCNLGELTDKGRETTLALGQRYTIPENIKSREPAKFAGRFSLRHLYVDQLGFMPSLIANADTIYLRATPMPRALESVQQSFWGMYPPTARTASFPPPTITTRTSADETLFPNEGSCRRFAQLSSAFAQRAADRWNNTSEMDFLNTLISKWMPAGGRVAVDSHPRLSGIMDTVNSTLAHGPETLLPPEFYHHRGREIIDKIGVEEWFSGYKESNEYRKVGIGSLVGDIVSKLMYSVEGNGNDGLLEVGGRDGDLGKGGRGETDIRFSMSGCHDTTLAAILSSLGAFEGEKWPPYTSHIAVELFREKIHSSGKLTSGRTSFDENKTVETIKSQKQSLWSSIFGTAKEKLSRSIPAPEGMVRRTMDELKAEEKEKLDGYYVRIRYNDRPMTIPGCKLPGKHLEGDETFCTLEAFKRIADKFTPEHWKKSCVSNLDSPAFPKVMEEAGY